MFDTTHGIDHLSPEPPRSPMLIEHRPGHVTQGFVFFPPRHFGGGVYGLKNGCS
jgi:hypothetical protein